MEAVIQPIFPQVEGEFQLPSGPATDQLAWILSELATGETTTIPEIQAHFIPEYNAESLQADFDFLRATFPDALVTDIVVVSPVRVEVVVESPGGSDPKSYWTIVTEYIGSKRVKSFFLNDFFGTVQFVEDQNLTLSQAADKYQTLAQETSLLVAQLDRHSQCLPVLDRNASTLRAMGGIFGLWVLGGLAQTVTDGTVAVEDDVELVASELALGGMINDETLGTLFTVDDLASLMFLDNTATDLLHELAGRNTMGQFINASGVADANVLKPLLSNNELFHLIYSFPLATSLTYVNGTEMFQDDFLQNQIVPLGAVTSFPFSNFDLMVEGSWQASPMEICGTLAKLRLTSGMNDASGLVDRALSAIVSQPGIRTAFDRVWHTGGFFTDGGGNRVLGAAWLLESNGSYPYVVVAMANNPSPGDIDAFAAQSLTSRMIQLVAEGQ